MKLADDEPGPDGDAPRRRRREKSEPFVAFAREVFRGRLPPWPTAVAIGILAICYTVATVLAPVASTFGADLVTTAELLEQTGTIELELAKARFDIETAAKDRETALLADVDLRIGASCDRDVALLLRWMNSTKLIDGGALPPDLQICMLLEEKKETQK